MTWDDVRRILGDLPGADEGLHHGTPAFRVGRKFLTRLREPDVVVLRCDFDEREMLMAAEPETFFITDHYRGYPTVLARLSRIDPGTLKRMLVDDWRRGATRKMIAELEARKA